MELALSLEKLNFQKLMSLHEVADKHGDAQMADFVGNAQSGRCSVLLASPRRLWCGCLVVELCCRCVGLYCVLRLPDWCLLVPVGEAC
jgi:hypothetical protein